MDRPKTCRAHLGDIVSAYTGLRLTIDGSLDGVEHMVQFMINRKLMEHQYPRALDAIKPALAEQFPWLTGLELPQIDDTDAEQARIEGRRWLLALIDLHGSVQVVQRLPEGVYEDIDPIVELRSMMRPDATIITAMATGYSLETFENPEPGMFTTPRFDDD